MKPNRFFQKLFILTLFVCFASPTLITTTASASQPCSGTASNRFAGASTSTYSQNIFGVRALITKNIPAICTSNSGSFGASLIWSMITAKSISYSSTSAPDGWAQSGYANIGYQFGEPVTGIVTFSQWTKSCKSYLNCTGSEVVTTYKAELTNIQYHDSSGNLHFANLGPIFISSSTPRSHVSKWNPTSGGTGLRICTDPIN